MENFHSTGTKDPMLGPNEFGIKKYIQPPAPPMAAVGSVPASSFLSAFKLLIIFLRPFFLPILLIIHSNHNHPKFRTPQSAQPPFPSFPPHHFLPPIISSQTTLFTPANHHHPIAQQHRSSNSGSGAATND